MTNQEKQFHQAMVDIYEEARRKYKYNATYLLANDWRIWWRGSSQAPACKGDLSEGFGTLRLYDRLDLTVEAHVLKPEFASLFTAEEIDVAKKRLAAVGYPIPNQG